MPERARRIVDMIEDFEILRARCDALGARLRGLSLLFGGAAALIVAAGLWLGAPVFAVGSGMAIAAALAFALAAQAATSASRAAPRVRPLPVAVRLERPRRAA